MLPEETQLTAKEVGNRLAKLKGKTVMHPDTLHRAIKSHGLPAHENPFGRGYIFYWSEIQEWLQGLRKVERPAPVLIRRGPGRPRKVIP